MIPRFMVATLILASACSSREDAAREPEQPNVVCTMEARSAIAVTLVDAATGAHVEGATVRVTDGGFSENLNGFEGVYSGAHERAGTYTVIVSHPGYQQWQRAGIVVEEDECHVITEMVEARLTRRTP